MWRSAEWPQTRRSGCFPPRRSVWLRPAPREETGARKRVPAPDGFRARALRARRAWRWSGSARRLRSVELAQLSNGLDHIAQQLDTEKTRSVIIIGSATGMTALLSAGYVLWALRGGTLLASMLATLPVWRWLDPLPILESREDDEKRKRKRGAGEKDKDKDEQDEERLRSVFG